MKKNLSLIVLLFVLLTSAGCRKCYNCHNSCSVCQDAHYTILVQSDQLSALYYTMYIDSLTSPGLGWTCHDTAPNKQMEVCGEKGNQIKGSIFIDQEAGWTCVPK